MGNYYGSLYLFYGKDKLLSPLFYSLSDGYTTTLLLLTDINGELPPIFNVINDEDSQNAAPPHLFYCLNDEDDASMYLFNGTYGAEYGKNDALEIFYGSCDARYGPSPAISTAINDTKCASPPILYPLLLMTKIMHLYRKYFTVKMVMNIVKLVVTIMKMMHYKYCLVYIMTNMIHCYK
eukprot:292378_1